MLRRLDQQTDEEVNNFETLAVAAIREIFHALEEIRDGLEYPAAEHVGYRVDGVAETLRGLEILLTENRN